MQLLEPHSSTPTPALHLPVFWFGTGTYVMNGATIFSAMCFLKGTQLFFTFCSELKASAFSEALPNF